MDGITDNRYRWILLRANDLSRGFIQEHLPFLHELWISIWDMTFKNNEVFTQRKVLAYYEWWGDGNISVRSEIGCERLLQIVKSHNYTSKPPSDVSSACFLNFFFILRPNWHRTPRSQYVYKRLIYSAMFIQFFFFFRNTNPPPLRQTPTATTETFFFFTARGKMWGNFCFLIGLHVNKGHCC